jgi:hypothetical protein
MPNQPTKGQPGEGQHIEDQRTPSPLEGRMPAAPITNFNIGEEFGTARRNLPPARIVLIAIAIIAIIIGIVAYRGRPTPQGGGSIQLVSAVELPGQTPATTLAAITFALRNTTQKSLWVRSLRAQLIGADGHTYEDEAASAVDLDRYYQLFPSLKESSEPPLPPETKLSPGTERRATIVVSFPVTKETFDRRKSLDVEIQPYDQVLPVILK